MLAASCLSYQPKPVTIRRNIITYDMVGNLIAFSRMHGASAVSATVAQGKAAVSAGLGRAKGALQADSPIIQAIIATMGGRMLAARVRCLSTQRGNSLGHRGKRCYC